MLGPQGSVLGPWLFILYTADLADDTEARCDVTRVYTDDTQLLYLQCHRDNTASSALHLECCLLEINQWQSSTKQLNLNVIGPAFLSFIFRSCISSAMSSPVAGGVVVMARARCCSCFLTTYTSLITAGTNIVLNTIFKITTTMTCQVTSHNWQRLWQLGRCCVLPAACCSPWSWSSVAPVNIKQTLHRDLITY